MSTTITEFSCFAPTCSAPHRIHFVLNDKQENGKVVWTVSAKTLFDIAFCYIRSRQSACKCSIANWQKCNWCHSTSQLIYAASYFCYQNSHMEEIVTKFSVEFSMKSVDNSYYLTNQVFDKTVVVKPLEIMKIVNEEQREQYLSDHVFD